jgi:methionine-rich copper-binding protein CopC
MASSRTRRFVLLAANLLLLGCAAGARSAPDAAGGILKSSTPGDGSTVKAPVERLELRFSPPARLLEVTVTGGDGLTTPMMVNAVGEAASYAVPLPGLEPGAYTVVWTAAAGGGRHQGAIRFEVR